MQAETPKSAKAIMADYKFQRVGTITQPDALTFSATFTMPEAAQWEKAVYIFVFNDEITRIGSSKAKLGKRMSQWSRDITNAFHRLAEKEAKKSVTPDDEAKAWLDLLTRFGSGEIYAREATEVTTPIGTFRAYMDEESLLINRHKPPLNRHSNR